MKAQGIEVETVATGVNETRRILLGEVIIKNLWKKNLLGARAAFNGPHRMPPADRQMQSRPGA